jgi:hypothetical protein
MVDPRKQALEDFAKKVELGDYSTTTMVSPEKTLFNQGLSARDVAEKTLAKKVLDNTGISIPDNGSIKQLEEFLGRVAKERYPEIDPNIRILQENEKNYLKGNKGLYGKLKSGSPIIALNRKILQSGDILDPVATLLHELGHQYDEERLSYEMPKELKNINNKSQLSKEKAYALAKKSLPRSLDPSDFYEAAAEGHHANIPNLREGSYGLGALKSYLKSGDFRGVTGPLGAAVESVKDLYKEAPIEESSKLGRLHGISTVAAKALGPLAIASGVVPVAADIKEGKPNTALARAVSYAAPMGAEDLTDKLMQTAEISDTSPELQDPEYRKLLMRIGQKRVERGGSPVIKSFSGREVDTSRTEDSDFLNRIKALQDLKTQG